MILLFSKTERLLRLTMMETKSRNPPPPPTHTHKHTLFSVGKIGWVVLKKEVVYDELSY